MKIISHNINGINAYKNNDKLNELLKFNADVYCLQEVRCNNEKKILSILGEDIQNKFEIISNVNTERKGYAGVTTLVNKETAGKLLIAIDIPQFNSPNLTSYAKGRIITLYFTNCILINIYSINSGGPKQNERIAFEQLLNAYVKKLKEDFHIPIIIAGDLNVCAKQIDYYGNFEKDYNEGPSTYDFEIAAFNKLMNENGLIDSYRFCNINESKYSTYVKIKRKVIAARIDYILVDNRVQRFIQSASIHDDFCEIDHKPIELNINLPLAFK